VTAAHIDYEEDNIDFNTVIHKHPDNCMSFSGTDEKYINSNFDFSLLWVNKKLHIGYIKINCDHISKGLFVRLNLNIKQDSYSEYLPKEAEEKIIKKSTYNWQRQHTPYHGNNVYTSKLENPKSKSSILKPKEASTEFEDAYFGHFFPGFVDDLEEMRSLQSNHSLYHRFNDDDGPTESKSKLERISDYEEIFDLHELERIATACGVDLEKE
jgi:hypothetical protein